MKITDKEIKEELAGMIADRWHLSSVGTAQSIILDASQLYNSVFVLTPNGEFKVTITKVRR